jgi:adenylate kinase family enzyme
MNSKAFLLYGRSGSGKGTQADLLIEYLKQQGRRCLYIETGEQFRDFIKRDDNYTVHKTKLLMDSGKLLPAFLPIYIWGKDVVEGLTGKEDLILDGLARRAEEVPVLDSMLDFYGFNEPIVIFLNTSPEWCLERMRERGRSDDHLEYVKRRLAWFDESVMPAIRHFENNPHYHFFDINGEQSIEEVHRDIMALVTPLL